MSRANASGKLHKLDSKQAEQLKSQAADSRTRPATITAEFVGTDTGNAERLVTLSKGDLRYCRTWRQWLAWTGKYWRVDAAATALRLTKDVVSGLFAEAARCKSEPARDAMLKSAKQSAQADRRRAMLSLALSERDITIDHSELDRNSWLLNCRNGTVDLRTGKVSPHRREDFITKMAPFAFDAGAKCPTWEAFLKRVLPDSAMRAFVHRLAGYSVSGEQSEQVITFCIGDGSNGKSTLLAALMGCLGRDYAIQASSDVLLRRTHQAHPTELADLFGVRLAVCVEIGEDAMLDEVLVKQLTGGEPIRARRMRQDFWQFDATHHLWLAANHRPVIRGVDHAIWRRIVLIPFNVTFTEEDRDRRLASKLRAEGPGILTWLVQGCLEWREHGLKAPAQIASEVEAYRNEMDTIGDFIEENCVRGRDHRVFATPLYGAYVEYCRGGGLRPIDRSAFGTKLLARGFTRIKSHGKKCYLGLDLAADQGADAAARGPRGGSSDLGVNEASNKNKWETGPRGPHDSTDEGSPPHTENAPDGATEASANVHGKEDAA